MALVDMTVVEQRYRAVLAVQRGETDVAALFGVSRQSVHTWCVRYAADGLAGLVDRSHRPGSCPHQTAPEMEAWVCEIRREHPGWGAHRIVHELARLAGGSVWCRRGTRCTGSWGPALREVVWMASPPALEICPPGEAAAPGSVGDVR